jgi:hypothetical protein
VSGHKQHKKDGGRKDKKEQARKGDFAQAVVGAEAPQRPQDTSNLTDGDIAGPDHEEKVRGRA